MTTTMLAAFLALAPAGLAQDEDEDERNPEIEALISKLAREGPSARLVELSRTESGFRAIEEAVHAAVGWKTRGFEADPWTHYEAWLFTRDAKGALAVRPERRADLESLARRVDRAKALFEDFNRRMDAKGTATVPAGAAAPPTELRLALFRIFAEACQEEALETLDGIAAALKPGADGKLRPAGEEAEELAEVLAEMAEEGEELADFEQEYLAFAARAPEGELRQALTGEFARRYMASRIAATETDEDDANALPPLRQALADLGTSETDPDWAKIRAEIARGEALHREVQAEFDRLAAGLADDQADLKEHLRDAKLRVRIAERTAALRAGAMAEVEEALAEAEGDEEEGPVHEYREVRSALRDLAERSTDRAAAAIFSSGPGTAAVQAHVDEVMERLREEALRDAIPAFTARYLEDRNGTWHWRADRAERVDEIVRRAAEIEKEEDEDR